MTTELQDLPPVRMNAISRQQGSQMIELIIHITAHPQTIRVQTHLPGFGFESKLS
jgi:hypothetical protein